MLTRKILSIAGISTGLIVFAACGTAVDKHAAPVVEHVQEPLPTATAAPTATPEPVVDIVETSDEPDKESEAVESIGHYSQAHNYLNRGDYIQAERRFSLVIEIEPEFARAWAGRGESRLYKGEYEAAISDLATAISLKPDLSAAYASRGEALLNLGDVDAAKSDIEVAIALDPEDARTWIVKGRISNSERDFVTALSAFDTAILLAPDQGVPFFWRARLFSSTGQNEFAIGDLDRAIEYSPSLSAAYLEKGVLIAQSGDFVGARALIEEARDRAEDPRNESVYERAQDLLDQLDEQAPPSG
ncbi:MAG: tetratricopeptide repeat protein [Chloroflexi bacterium]|nr:tetratricopeptide repeat protein [Chloroflexota bacterium]